MRPLLFAALLAGCGDPLDAAAPGPADDTDSDASDPSAAPVITSVELTVPPASSGEAPACTAVVSPPGDDATRLGWHWSLDGRDLGVDAPALPRDRLTGPGTLTCTVTPIRDGLPGTPRSASQRLHGPGGNILVLLADDMGVDKVGVYDAHPYPARTPRLEALAAEGLRFDRAYSQSVCSPSRAAALTGRVPSRHGVGWWIDVDVTPWSLPDEELTLPEMLALSPLYAYTSVALGKWHLVGQDHLQPGRHVLQAGFAHHRGSIGNPNGALAFPGQATGYYRWEKWTDGEAALVRRYMTTELVDDALELLPSLPEPWFAWAAFNAPHTPHEWPPDHLHTVPRTPDLPVRRHAAAIEAMDTEIGRLLDGLAPEVLANTTVIFLSDNGTSSGVILPPWDPDRDKGTTYEGGIHVPMIVAGPHVSEPGRTTDALVHITDLFATAADLAGVDVDTLPDLRRPGGRKVPRTIDGRSWLPQLADPTAPPARTVLLAEKLATNGPPPWTEREWLAVDATHKIIRGPQPEAVFDLATSPWDEGEDLAGTSLDPATQIARDALGAALDTWDAALEFDHGRRVTGGGISQP